MRLPLKINNSSLYIECEPDEPLLSVLRRLHFFSAKSGCNKGLCGSCTVLLDEKPVPSCLIPVASVRDRNIITLEHFSQNEEYQDIITGFRQTGIKLCGFCNAGKIFAANEILQSNRRPARDLILRRIKPYSCPCTQEELLINGILAAYTVRQKRMGGLKYGQ